MARKNELLPKIDAYHYVECDCGSDCCSGKRPILCSLCGEYATSIVEDGLDTIDGRCRFHRELEESETR